MITAARLWNTNWIMPNYENESEVISPKDLRAHLDVRWNGRTVWSSLGWLPNSVDFSPITRDPMLLQIFPSDMKGSFPGDTRHDPKHVAKIAGDCVQHARVDHGFTYVGVTWQTYHDMEAEDYDCTNTHSTFPGNEISPDRWDAWYK